MNENNAAQKIREFFSGVKKGMREFGENIMIIINSILLAVVYIIAVGITSIIAKLVKKHFMAMKLSKKEKSYWEDFNLKKKKMDEYYRQF